MPQMAPMSWLLLMLSFVLTFLMFNSLNYFSFMYPPQLSKSTSQKLKINWKW
uniref:ATP synthase complex subunit 8 n=1 Tax=Nigidionus parryi TaxID=618206 RepID=A0A3G1CDD6_9SCAR|nr:ATP synthase F0 subunit 8 [Nigidionus parryi]